MPSMVRHVTEWEWIDLAKHESGALTKLLVTNESCGSKNIDFYISSYAPKAYAAMHMHEQSEEVFYFLDGEGVFMMGNTKHRIRKGSVIYVEPKQWHGIFNTGFTDLVFVVTATPPEPLWHEAYKPLFPPPQPGDPTLD